LQPTGLSLPAGSPANRRQRKANKIRRQLGWQPGILNAEGGKPKNMHWKTFLRLLSTYDALYIQDVLHMVQEYRLIPKH